jgi:hypothetical protein
MVQSAPERAELTIRRTQTAYRLKLSCTKLAVLAERPLVRVNPEVRADFGGHKEPITQN